MLSLQIRDNVETSNFSHRGGLEGTRVLKDGFKEISTPGSNQGRTAPKNRIQYWESCRREWLEVLGPDEVILSTGHSCRKRVDRTSFLTFGKD